MSKVNKKTTPHNTAKQKRKKWGTSVRGKAYKPSTPVVKQAAVLALYLQNNKKLTIARELGLDRETVARIISQQENETLLQRYRDVVMKMVPDALIGAHHLVKQVDRQMITDILYGSRTLIQRHEVQKVEEPKRTYAYTKVEFFGKYGRWPLDSELAKFEKTLTIEPLVKEDSE